MATGTATPLKPAAVGPVRSIGAKNPLSIITDITVGVYATGGVAVTLPALAKKQGLRLKALKILTPIKLPSTIRYYSWDGSRSAPKIVAVVASTGAQVAADVDLSGVTLTVEFVFGD